MAEQQRKPRPKKEEEAPQATESTKTETKDEELEDLLDEIDEVLEVNSEDFVRGFVQKGGQLLLPMPVLLQHDVPIALALLLVVATYAMWWRQRSQ